MGSIPYDEGNCPIWASTECVAWLWMGVEDMEFIIDHVAKW